MCGRFAYFAKDSAETLERVIAENLPGLEGLDKYSAINRDIYPSQIFPTIIESDERPLVEEMKWGYPPASKKSKSLLINARAETAANKYTFRYDFLHRRCLIPATGFYEWNKQKEKFLFTDKAGLLFIGGLYTKAKDDPEDAPDRFVILTREPDSIVSQVHNRMPVLVPFDLASAWLTKPGDADSIINNYSVKLNDIDQAQLRLV